MKTRKLLLSIFCILFCLSGAIAQTYYYKTSKTFNESGYTYQCDVSVGGKFTVLYNKSNKYAYADLTYKDGKPLPVEYYNNPHSIRFVETDTWSKGKSNSIITGAIMGYTQGKPQLKGQQLTVTMYMDPATGKVIEVDFHFSPITLMGTVPISVFRKIETDLKSQIWFTPTAEGKKMNYLMKALYYKVP